MFEFLFIIGLVLAYYGYSVAGNPRVWGEQGIHEISEKNWIGYVIRNGKFFMYSGFLLAGLAALDVIFQFSSIMYTLILVGGEALLYYPLGKWMKEKEGTWNAWPRRHKKKK